MRVSPRQRHGLKSIGRRWSVQLLHTHRERFCSKEDLPGANTSIGPVGPAQSITVQVGGVGGVPLTATAVVANVTVAGTVSGGFLTAYPGGTLPTVSDVNWTGPGEIVPNLVVVKLSSSGTITIYNNSGTVDVLVDVLGWYQ